MKITIKVPKSVATTPGLAMKGTQIVYVPPHLQFKLLQGLPVETIYPYGAQPGFIMSGPHHGSYFCRYWQCYEGDLRPELRTKTNSELVNGNWIFLHDTFDQEVIEKAIKEIESETT